MVSGLLIKNTNIIPMPGNLIMRNMDVLVEGTKIKSIKKHNEKIKASFIIDGKGKFLIPGLFDMHTHVHDESFYPLFLINGVTTVREMGSDREDIFEMRQKVNSGKVLGPRLYIAGPILEGNPPFWEGFRVVETANEAKEAVRDLKKKGVDFIKVYNTLKKEPYKAVLGEATKQNLRVTGHIPDGVDEIDALELGQMGIEHMADLVARVGKVKMKAASGKKYKGWSVFTDVVINQKSVKALRHALEEKEGYICPTLVMSEQLSRLSDYENLRVSKEAEYLADYADTDWNPSHPKSTPYIRGMKPLFFDNYKVIYEASKQLLKLLSGAGTILAGSDTPNPFVVPGFSLLRELELLVQCGLKPYQALESATYNGAKFLNILDELGTVERGKIANLVLLKENPLEDISATRSIIGVVINGDYYSRDELDKKLPNN